ncbi:hypothetical protein HYH02_000276 [Chlamydomonas schloesseri]|uniref:Uncharacterized protein n=1 Tax=Chlamydomonas schloesseri TaxID=2026947 RepID=A0A836B8A1_9CHLO|nr:hypothetical protein HYH02_000276 [Chlamydomonas schloesseri]|eukprot:KAG2450174.1 hypothetical protein HYH02_000276 [Chlamydomonas schloesseri]
MKRRSVDMPLEAWAEAVQAKRVMSQSAAMPGAFGFSSAVRTQATSHVAESNPADAAQVACWLAVAAQVQEALSVLGPGWISAAQTRGSEGASTDLTSGVSTPAVAVPQPVPHRPGCTSAGVSGPLYQLPCCTVQPAAAAPAGAWAASAPQASAPHSAVGQQAQQLHTSQPHQPQWLRPSGAGFGGEASSHLRQQHSGPVLQQDFPFSTLSSAAGAPAVAAAMTVAAGAAAAAATDLPAQPAGAMDSNCSELSDNSAAFGWFSKCRGCCQLTAGEMELRGQAVPLCRGCSRTLMKKAAPEQDATVNRIMRSHQVLLQREAAAAGASSGASAASL